MRQFEYVVTDSMGIHARPAGMLAKEAKRYESKIFIKKDEKSVEVTKLMAIMGLGIKCGQTVGVEVSGADEDVACEEMKRFFEANL